MGQYGTNQKLQEDMKTRNGCMCGPLHFWNNTRILYQTQYSGVSAGTQTTELMTKYRSRHREIANNVTGQQLRKKCCLLLVWKKLHVMKTFFFFFFFSWCMSLPITFYEEKDRKKKNFSKKKIKNKKKKKNLKSHHSLLYILHLRTVFL